MVSSINMATMIKHHTNFPPTPAPLSQTSLPGYSLALPGWIYSPSPPQHTNKYLWKCTFSKSLTKESVNLKEPYNQAIKIQVINKDSGINFSNNISIPQGNWTWLDLWNLLTVSLNDKCFHNSIHYSGFYLQLCLPLWLGKIFRFTVFRLLEKCICETFSPSRA